MNLTDELPNFVECNGNRYEIHTDFRVWLRVDKLLFSCDLPPVQKAAEMLALCYKKQLPPDAAAALRLLMQFYCGGVQEGKNRTGGSAKRIYDFEQDAELFYAAFLEKYRLDLTVERLHWWKFLALFRALDRNCRLCSVMHWRAADLSQITDKKQKDFYRKMKRHYRLTGSADSSDTGLAEILSEAVGRGEDENEK